MDELPPLGRQGNPGRRDNFFHTNTLACLTGTTLCVASVTQCLDSGLKTEICIKEMKFDFSRAVLIERPRETQRKRGVCIFDYSIRFMNNHARATLIRPLRKPFTYKRSIKLCQGEGCLGYTRPYNQGLRVSELFVLKTHKQKRSFFMRKEIKMLVLFRPLFLNREKKEVTLKRTVRMNFRAMCVCVFIIFGFLVPSSSPRGY